MFTGGDLTEITYNNPEVGSGRFFPKAGEAFNVDPGGFINDDDAAGIAGNNQAIYKMTNSRWSVEGPVAWDSNDNEELEKLKAVAASTKETTWTFTHVNGTVYGGSGKPVGPIVGDAGAATIALKIMGGGGLKKVA